jgi:hypothetical protein
MAAVLDEFADLFARGSGLKGIEVIPSEAGELADVDFSGPRGMDHLADPLADHAGVVRGFGAADGEQ